MRNQNTIVAALLTVVLFASTGIAGFSPVEYFDFTGWDHEQISTVGQTFTDIAPGVDVTVTSMGAFDEPSTAFGTTISSVHTAPLPGSHSFRFVFSEDMRLVIATEIVDPNERQSIYTASTETYMNTSGSAATVVPDGSGISITGNGFGISETGASFGETLTGPASTLTLSYYADSTVANKYGQWMVGQLVPEPNSVALLGIGGLGMLLQLRRRRN